MIALAHSAVGGQLILLPTGDMPFPQAACTAPGSAPAAARALASRHYSAYGTLYVAETWLAGATGGTQVWVVPMTQPVNRAEGAFTWSASSTYGQLSEIARRLRMANEARNGGVEGNGSH